MSDSLLDPVMGVRVGLIGRRGLVARGRIARVLPDGRVAVEIDGSKRRFFFVRGGDGCWSSRGLARSDLLSVRFVAEPPVGVARVPLRRASLGRRREVH